MLESQIQKQVLKYLKDNKIYHFRYQAQVNLNGLPDIIALYKGIFIGIELKKPDGKPTGLQKKKLKTINENGGIGVIIKSVEQLDCLIKTINEYEEGFLLGEMTNYVLLDMFLYRWKNESKQIKNSML